jgi:nitrogenase subunit NifH
VHIIAYCPALDGCGKIGPGCGGLRLSSCSLWRRNMVFPANGWVVGYDVLGAIVTCFGFMLLINDGFSYAGFERVG